MNQPVTADTSEKSNDVIDLQKQIADLLRKNQSLEQENEKLSKRFGLVWPEQPEFFVQVISDTEVVYQKGLYRRVGALETNGSKARLDFDGSNKSEDLKRGDSPYLYTGKQSDKTYLGNGGVAYEWKKHINEDYLPALVKKGSRLGFDGKDGQRKNLLIEGDNYHALQVLQHTHRGDIDVIYIDPPYNTGNKDFKYNDKFVSDEDGNKHSSWLSFMKRRLELAKKLLSEDGVIFVSIDDAEMPNLTAMMNDVFGENKKLGVIPVLSNPRGRQSSLNIAESHEYIIVFCNSSNKKVIDGIEVDDKKIQKDYPLVDSNGKRYRHLGLRKRGSDSLREDCPNLYYPIYLNVDTGELSLEPGGVEITPVDSKGRDGRWRWGKKKFKSQVKKLIGKKVSGRQGERYDVFEINYCAEKKREKVRSLWAEKEINYDRSSHELSSIFGEKSFDYAKPLYLIKKIVSLFKKDVSVLDFFAGSGTTGHAVWEINKEDGGDRTFILVTNNESNICEDVTYERLRRCNLPDYGDYQQGLEYLQLKHVAETEVDGYDMAKSFEHIKQVVNVRFGSFDVIEETDDWYVTDKIAVLKNYVKHPAFFEKYGNHKAYGLVTKKERQTQTFRSEASKRVSVDDIHIFNKEYLNDLYRVVREDMA